MNDGRNWEMVMSKAHLAITDCIFFIGVSGSKIGYLSTGRSSWHGITGYYQE